MGTAFLLAASAIVAPPRTEAATISVSWASGTEADLAGYRLRLGTASAQYTRTIEPCAATSCDVTDLATDQTYYLAVYAFDVAGNESPASEEVQVRIPSTLAPLPIVDSLTDVASGSIFVIRGQAHSLLLTGRNIQSGATLTLGAGIVTSPLTPVAPSGLSSLALVSVLATPGPRTATLINPDLGTSSTADALEVVKTPDTNADCSIDVLDLNALARAWNLSTGESGFILAADLDGDGYIGPEDLTIFVKFLGKPVTGCP
jgi:hypothetical protein